MILLDMTGHTPENLECSVPTVLVKKIILLDKIPNLFKCTWEQDLRSTSYNKLEQYENWSWL